MSGRVLLIDDDRAVCELLHASLTKKGFSVAWCTSGREGIERLTADEPDVVVTDLNLHGMSGFEICQHVAESAADVPVIVITAFGSMETAISAIRAGAYDFITKPFDMDLLRLTLERAIAHRALRTEVKRLRKAASGAQRSGELIGGSTAMKKLYSLIERVAETDTSVLVTGESGTGKELVSRALHERSARKERPFVAINCAALPEPLLESELFGHARGAFTDAKAARQGLFVRAQGGTVLLDEIGDMPLGLQPKLLRALQERTVRPVGSDEEIPFDVRLVAATNRDLETAVEERRFREDLYYRVNVVHLELPPLRSRGSDILLLAQSFLDRHAASAGRSVKGLSPAAAQLLMAYRWPGNVRELSNCIERAVALARFDELGVDDLPEKVRNHKSSHVVVASDDPSELPTMDEVERRYILRVIDAAAGNKTLAAQILGLDRATLYRKLSRYGLPST